MTIEYKDSKRIVALSTDTAVISNRGTVTTSGSDTIITFTESGTFTPTSSFNVETVVVAGGGGSGGGGGGAGGIVYDAVKAVTPQNYTITVGSGGDGGDNSNNGTAGEDSVFDNITAKGGGYGAKDNTNGGSGGSGGGGGATSINVGAGGSSTQTASGGDIGYGNAGGSYGNNSPPHPNGGGGGAGAVGGDGSGSTCGSGGIGIVNPISGSTIGELSGGSYYLGGGGGGGRSGLTQGSGGLGGGGNGSASTGENGTANTGGGGGGSYGNTSAGNGGSGVVIIKFPTSGNTYDTSLGGKPSNVQDNSLLVEKDTARRYWLTPQTVDTEEAFSFTTTDTVNALWGNRIYGMKLLSGHSGLNKYIKKIKTYHPTNPTGSRLTTGTLYHVILDSSGTEIARSAGVSASSVSNNSWAETTLSTPVKLEENYTVGATISTGSGSIYLGTAVNNNSSSPTNTTRYYKDEFGTESTSTSETILMVFDSDPATGLSIPSTWTMQPTETEDYDTTTGFTTEGSGVTVDNADDNRLYFNASASSSYNGQHRALSGALDDSKWVADFEHVWTTSTSAPDAMLIGFTEGTLDPVVTANDQNMIAVGSTSGGGLALVYKEGTNARSFGGTIFTPTTAVRYYCRLIRDGLKITLIVYADSDRSEVLATGERTMVTGIVGLDNLMHCTSSISPVSRPITAEIDNLSIYDGVTSIN